MNKMNRGRVMGLSKAPGASKPPTTSSGSHIQNQGKLLPVTIAQNAVDTATHTSMALQKAPKGNHS